MTGPKSLPTDSEIVASLGRPRYDRRLADKILAAFNHAYTEGAHEVAMDLRRALETVERDVPAALRERRGVSALHEAELWTAFVDAREAFKRACADAPVDAPEVAEARTAMIEAYRRWSDG